MEILSLQAAHRPSVKAEPELFAGLPLPRHDWTTGIGASLALHALAIAGTLAMQWALPLIRPDSLDAGYALQTLPLRAAQRLYYQVEPQPQRPAPKGASPGGATRRRPNLQLAPGIEIPRLPEPPRLDSVAIQQAANLADVLPPLPVISAWAPREVQAPKAFLAPGRTRPPAERPVLDAPPSLDRPNREPRLSDLNFTGPPSIAPPPLPRPPSSTTPVRVMEPPKPLSEPVNAGIGLKEGDAASLITAGPVKLPPNTYLSVPPAAAGASAGPGSDAPAKPAAAPGSSAPASAAETKPQARELTAIRDTAPPMPLATKITRPVDGRFNVVVMGSSPADSFPEIAGVLSGKIVYTVYLGINRSRDWILQYCLPKSAATGTGKLDAPYPYLMFHPRFSLESDGDYLFVHGLISDTGAVEQLEVVGDAEVANQELLLSAIRHWGFRPATRGGAPTAVEMLLIIPRPER